MPIIPATQEAETGESLEHGRQRLRRAEIVPLNSSPGQQEQLRLKEKKRDILPFVTIWMNLENIMLSEINQTQKTKFA